MADRCRAIRPSHGRTSEAKRVDASISADIEAILGRDQRLEASKTTQGFARKNRLTRIAAERVQPTVAFGAKHPHDGIGMAVRGGHNGGSRGRAALRTRRLPWPAEGPL